MYVPAGGAQPQKLEDIHSLGDPGERIIVFAVIIVHALQAMHHRRDLRSMQALKVLRQL
jgi:hypothetical protein